MKMILDYNTLLECDDLSRSEIVLRNFLLATDILNVKLGLIKHDPDIFNLCSNLNYLFDELFMLSDVELFYWDFCPSSVYMKTYKSRLDEFLEKNNELSECEFLDIEKNKILANIRLDGFYLHFEVIKFSITEKIPLPFSVRMDYLGQTQFSNLKAATKKKLSFLAEKIGKEIAYSDVEYEYLLDRINFKINSQSESSNNDYSYGLTPPEKFVMLHELGIIDFLKSKINVGYNDTILAKLLSTFTDVNAENMRKMLGGAKNGDHNNKITETSIFDFENRLRSLKIDPSFFRNKQSKSNK